MQGKKIGFPCFDMFINYGFSPITTHEILDLLMPVIPPLLMQEQKRIAFRW